MPSHALILGATGRFGRHTARALKAAGWEVTPFRRADDLTAAAKGFQLIVNGWNPPYHRWQAELPGLTQRVIAAAKAADATVLIPGNVYVFGAEMSPVIGPDTTHAAQNPLGRLRIDMEAAYRTSGIRTIVLRAGDFLDTEASGNWFDRIIAARAASGVLRYPGRFDAMHAWAYLPDLAQAAAGLADRRDSLPAYTDVAFEGYSLTAQDLADAAARATGRAMRLRRMSWLGVQMARPFWPEARHLIEMRYLWQRPHQLDGRALRALLPDLAETPIEAALKAALPG